MSALCRDCDGSGRDGAGVCTGGGTARGGVGSIAGVGCRINATPYSRSGARRCRARWCYSTASAAFRKSVISIDDGAYFKGSIDIVRPEPKVASRPVKAEPKTEARPEQKIEASVS